MAKTLSYNAVLVKREDYTPELSVFHLEYDEPLVAKADRPLFLPGQYVALGLNNETEPDKGGVRRSMSIASAPEQGSVLQFYIRYVSKPASDNPLTHLLWEAKEGDRIFATRKPVGKFTLEDTVGEGDPRTKIFVAAGTGLAPFVSIVRSRKLRDDKADMSDLVLLHGASYPQDLVFREELEGYARDHGLHYFPTVSRPKEAPDWTGHTGRAEAFFEDERFAELEQKVGKGALTPHNSAILICGLQGTVSTTLHAMIPRGFVPFDRKIRTALELEAEHLPAIWWEQYDTQPAIDLDDAELVARLKTSLHENMP
jgi:ferredoxin--NADP+ reductase